MPGNQEDRGREQLDQVSPLDIDSFFPFVLRASEKGSLSQRFQFLKHLWQTAQCRGCDKADWGHQEQTCPLRCQLLCNAAIRIVNKTARRTLNSQKHVSYIRQNWMSQKGCMEVYLGNSALPSVHFHELVKTQGACASGVLVIQIKCANSATTLAVLIT